LQDHFLLNSFQKFRQNSGKFAEEIMDLLLGGGVV